MNFFPAGFNNIVAASVTKSAKIVQEFLSDKSFNKLILLSEDFDRNFFYNSNVKKIEEIFSRAGIRTESYKLKDFIDDQPRYDADSVVLFNNDLSSYDLESLKTIKVKTLPPKKAGWFYRRKAVFYKIYNKLVGEFCNDLNIDLKFLSIFSLDYGHIDFNSKDDLEKLYKVIELLFESKGFNFSYIKSNRGTYGMGIAVIESAKDLLNLNRDARKKINYIKGGHDNNDIFIQEGIETILKYEDNPAEAVIYMITDQIIDVFYRSNSSKSSKNNLNSPDMIFVNHLDKDKSNEIGIKMEQLNKVYKLIAKLVYLTASEEMELYV